MCSSLAVVVLNSFDSIHEALVQKAESTSGRPAELKKLMKHQEGEDGIAFNPESHWKELRRFTAQALRDFGVGKTSLEENIVAKVDAMTTVLRDSKNKPLNVTHVIEKAVANILMGITFGKRYDFDDPEFEKLVKLMHEWMRGEGFFDASLFLPDFIAKLVETKENVRKQKVNDVVREYIYKEIQEQEDTFDIHNIRDFIDLYLKAVKTGETKNKKYVSKENTYRVINELFLAGAETTSVSLQWTCVFLIEYPDVQKKCQQELEKVVGHRAVRYADRNNLPYVCATIMEILRRSSIGNG